MSVDISDRFVTDLMYKNMQQLRHLAPTSFDRKVEEQCGYRDTDGFDTNLYHHLGIKYGLSVNKCRLITYVDGKKINMSADAWMGVKQLASISHDTKEWIKFYESIQSNLRLRLLWPSHRLPTINTSRYTCFHDRVDLLLADLKRWFSGQPALLSKTYRNRETGIWLNSFDSFGEFTKSMQLDWLVKDGYIIDLVNLTVLTDQVDLDELRHNCDGQLMRRYVVNSIKLVTDAY